MKKFFREFKAFISRGNVFDMAVGVIIATAFNKIVSSLVNDIIMPLVTFATGAASLADLSLPLRWDAEGKVTLSWAYGNFIQTIIDFLIIAFSIFVMVKLVNLSREKFKELGEYANTISSKEYKQERKMVKQQAKKEKRKFEELWKEHIQAKKLELEAKQKQEAEAKALEEANKPKPETQEDILKDIRDLLKQGRTLPQPTNDNKKEEK